MDKVPKETLIEWVQNIIDRRGTEDEIDQLIKNSPKQFLILPRVI
jgi:hypothetical protein